MERSFKVSNRCLTILLPKELDHHYAEKIREEADKIIQRNGINRLIFDFSNTIFMDSSGIGVVMGRYKNLHYTGGKVEACNLSPRVEKIFRLSGLNKLIEINEL